ncbi:MAG: radical SAM protein [Calditrichaeota bacterium]|nr:MAG: radical SAM protein [Calditrichota bacterium]
MKLPTPTRKIKPRVDETTLMVNEIFYSIQGESSHAGRPCLFVRLTYCNLRCSYCDTEYAFYEGQPRQIDSLLAEIVDHPCPVVEITGGEPLLQPAVFPLMKALCEAGKTVLLETSGSRPLEKVDPRVIKIVDFKCPSSGMAGKNLESNVNCLSPRDEVKFVVGTREDFDWAVAFVEKHRLASRVGWILFSPVWGQLPPLQLTEWLLGEPRLRALPSVRLQLQMHKFIWPPDQRGV